MREFNLEEAQKIFSEGKNLITLVPNEIYQEGTGFPIGLDKDSDPYYDAYHAWEVDAKELQLFLSRKGVDFNTILSSEKGYLRSFLKNLERILKNWGENKYPNLKQRIKGVYSSGEEFLYWRDLNTVLKLAKKEIFVIDPYASLEVLNEYLNFRPGGVKTRFITNKKYSNKFIVGVKKVRDIECKVTSNIHDRLIFIDDTCCLSGTSIKDGAGKKPTYLIHIETPAIVEALRSVYEDLWNKSSSI